MASESRQAVIAAIAGNLLIAVSKFVAAAISGSAAMFSEAMHSLVDTGNGGLMLYGIRRSRKPPDEAHPFGYGHELYFWSMVVGVVVFALGGGMSILNGIEQIRHPAAPQDPMLNYSVIVFAAVFEAISWYFGVKAFRAERRGRGVFETIRVTKDPTTFSVALEDSAALVGLAFAFGGIALSRALDKPWLDGAASVLIGLLLCVVAFVMVYESRGLLVGEGVEKRVLEELRRILRADADVERLDKLATVYLGPDEILLAIDVRFTSDMELTEVRKAIVRIRDAIQTKYPRIRHVFLDVTSLCK